QDFNEFRPSKLWRKMPAERRMAAAELFWSDDQSTDQQLEAVAALAAHMKFRAKSVISLPLEKKAKYLSTLPSVSDAVAARALVNYHLERQRPMMGAFLDSLGIAHENGLISEDSVAKPDPDTLKTAASGLAGQYPAEDVNLYLSTLVSQDPDTWGALADSIQ
ncbi:MAG: hypothetical protein ABI603_15805, partial [Acidobacteriota bacterium]